ncbi:MAG TPA: nitrogen fixation protein NifZ [Novosphingobium sp.]|nr:nitrogen fixation protein NifZ [Novosphingobium sp.]
MIPLRAPVFRWGQQVRTALALVNDGSHPGFAPEAVIVPAGAVGEIVNVGHHEESDTPVYLVDFAAGTPAPCVVGCLEEELEELEAAP